MITYLHQGQWASEADTAATPWPAKNKLSDPAALLVAEWHKCQLCILTNRTIRHNKYQHHVVAADFLSRYLGGPLPYVWHHITVNKMCWLSR